MSDNKLNHFVSRAIPDHVREDHPQFALFIEKYFEYLARDLGEYDIAINLLDYTNIDKTVDDFYVDFKKEYIPLLPEKYKASLITIVKNARNFYQTKGTEDSYKTFFRMIFDTTVELYYPKVDMLRASDGKWTEPYYLTPLGETYADLLYFYDKSITGSVSGATAYVEAIIQITDPDNINAKIYVVSLVDRVGVFDVTDTFTVTGEVTPNFTLDTSGTKGIITGAGFWKGTDGFISWNKYIQDSDYYQDFSYVLESPISVELYEKPIRENLHPAGLKFFGLVTEGITLLDVGANIADFIHNIILWVNNEVVEQTINEITQVIEGRYPAPSIAGSNNFNWKYYEENKDQTAFIQLYTIDALGSLPISYASDNYSENFLIVTVGGSPTVLYKVLNENLILDTPLGSDQLISVVTTDPAIPVGQRSYVFSGVTGETTFVLPTIIKMMRPNGVVPSTFKDNRYIPTLTGTQYGVLNTPFVAEAGDTVEIKFATIEGAVSQMLLDNSVNATRGYIQFAAGVIDFISTISSMTLDGSAVTSGVTPIPADGKVHTIIATYAAGATVENIGTTFAISNHLQGQLLSVKFTDISTAVVTNYVFDSGSDLYQLPKGGELGSELWNNTTTIPLGSQNNHTAAGALIAGKTYALTVTGLSAGEDARYTNSGWQIINNNVPLIFVSASTQALVLRDFAEAQTGVTVTIRQLPDDACILTSFAATDWNNYRLQQNIVHDGGTISNAWVGNELVANGAYHSDTYWTKGLGWTIAGGIATHVTPNTNASLQQTINLLAGVNLLELDITRFTSGVLVPYLGGTWSTGLSAAGNYKPLINHSLTDSLLGLVSHAGSDFDGDIDNISLKHLLEII